ncbi:DUF3667 domain-containing protein [Massilia sp. DWR3-1-1]|uniref:DUF3667 domain-containing protein n=1 Tax=Massilia sp. DWR3-1-1 TaxID=2804559 RepID=UPI003CF7B79E
MNLDLEGGGALVTATLVAKQIDPPAAAVDHADRAHDSACANCGAQLTGPYCHRCGQGAHVHRSLLHLGEEFLHGLLHFDAKAWRTLPLLVLQPGRLTRNSIDGKRTRYVSPLALFLFMVFLMFFVVSSVSRTDHPFGTPASTAATTATDDGDEGKLDKVVDKLRLKQANIDSGSAAVDRALRGALDNPQLTLYKLKSSASKLSFMLVPMSLPLLWLMFFWKRGVTMYDHAVFSLYALSFMALLVSGVSLLGRAGLTMATQLLWIAPPIHMFLQLRGAYQLRVRGALWRTVALLFASLGVFVLYLLLILTVSVAL